MSDESPVISQEPQSAPEPTNEPIAATDEQATPAPETFAGKLFAAGNESPAPDVAEDDAAIFDGPFDAAHAWTVVTRVNTEFQDAIREHKRLDDLAKSAKKTRDALGERVSKLIIDFNTRKNDGPQPFLRTVKAGESELSTDALPALQRALLAKRCFLTTELLAGLTDAEREGLAKWAKAKGGPVWPPVLAKSHVAGAAPDGAITCRKCGQPFPAESQVGDIAGLDCAGVDLEDARPIKKRGSKKTKKVDHDTERAEQSADGRKREAATH